MKLGIGDRRRDGKFPVTLVFEGGPNAFGGHYPNKVFRKLYSLAQVLEAIEKHGTPDQRRQWLKAEALTRGEYAMLYD